MDGADVSAKWRGDERATDTSKASDDFVGGHFGGGPVELKEAGIDIIVGSDEEVKSFEAEVGKRDAEVEIVKAVEAKEHNADRAVENEEELMSVFGGLFEIETAFANIDFCEGINRLEDIPLSVGSKLDKGDGEGVLRTKFHSIAEAKKKNEERAGVADEVGGVVFDTVGEIEAEAELAAILGKNDDSIERHDEAGDSDDDSLILGNEGGADEDAEIEDIEGERVAIGTGILVFEVELLEDEGENGLDNENEDGVDREGAVGSGIHIHELDEGIDIEDGETVNQNSQGDADDETRHGGVFILVTNLADVGAGSERAPDDTVDALQWVSDGKDADKVFINDQT